MFSYKHILLILSVLACSGLCSQSNPVGDSYEASPGCYVVTPNLLWQLGAVWFEDPLNLDQAFEITLTMDFGNNDAGADGMVFVFQQVGIEAIGANGGGIGFSGFAPSLGIELDTWENVDLGDPFEDHIAMFKNGDTNHFGPNQLSPAVPVSATSANIEDGDTHTFEMTWDPAINLIEVYFDCELRLSETIDITANIFGGNPSVWWGFTGATGGASNEQTVCISEFALGLEPNYEVCLGNELELGVVGGTTGTYSWEPAELVDDPGAATVTTSPTEGTQFSVTYTDICGEETTLETWVDVIDFEVEVEEELFACEGESVTANAIGTADEYTWSTGDTGETLEIDEAGSYTVTGTVGECEISDEVVVEFWPIPDIVDWQETYSACEETPITIDGTSPDAETYDWSTGDDTPSITTTDGQIIDLEITSANGCTNSFTTAVTFFPYPEAVLPDSIQGCESAAQVLSAGAAESWLWDDGSVTQSISVSESGIYQVSMTSNGCTTEDSTVAVFYANPEFDWIESILICEDSLEALALPDEPLLWLWQNQEAEDTVWVYGESLWSLIGVDTITNCSTTQTTQSMLQYPPEITLEPLAYACEDGPALVEVLAADTIPIEWSHGETGPELAIDIPGIYEAVGTNICGTDTAVVEVFEALCHCPTYVPNAFTPDLDGLNELFFPEVDCEVRLYKFQIYDRWGELIFESFKQGEGWNGAGPGRTHWLPGGVYAWQLSYEVDLLGGWVQYRESGSVFLLR